MSTAEIVKVDTPRFVVAEGGQRHNVGEYTGIEPSANDQRVVELWINKPRKTNSEHTKAQYRRCYLQFAEAVGVPLQAVRYETLLDWQNSLTGELRTVRTKVSVIRSLFSFAHKIGYLRINPGVMLETPSVPDDKHNRTPTEEEVLSMITVTKKARDKTLLRVLYSSGARVSEILALKWQDVVPVADEKAVLMIFGKGGKNRQPGISAATYKELLKLRKGAAGNEPVFKSNRGTALDRSVAVRIVKQAAEAAGIEKSVSPHWFRHGHVSHTLDRGANPEAVRQQVGHSSLATTTGYAHASSSSADVLAV